MPTSPAEVVEDALAEQMLVDVGVLEKDEDSDAKVKAQAAKLQDDAAKLQNDTAKVTKTDKRSSTATPSSTLDPLAISLTKRNEEKDKLAKTSRLPVPESITNAQNALPLKKAVLTVEMKPGAVPVKVATAQQDTVQSGEQQGTRGEGTETMAIATGTSEPDASPTTSGTDPPLPPPPPQQQEEDEPVPSMPMTRLTRAPVARQQPSEPGAIAIEGENSGGNGDDADLEAAENAMNNLNGASSHFENNRSRPYGSAFFPDHLVSAHLVPDPFDENNEEQAPPNASHSNDQQVYAVATVARDHSRAAIGGGLLAVLIAVIVVLATTLSGNNNNNNQSGAAGVAVSTTSSGSSDGESQDEGAWEFRPATNVPDLSYEESLQYGQTMKGPGNDNRFGAPLAFSNAGDILAVGARDNNDVAADSGMVRVYKVRNKTIAIDAQTNTTKIVWEQLGNALFGQSANDEFAFSGMALSGDGMRLAVGAPFLDVTTTNVTSNGTEVEMILEDAGSVQVFELTGNTWSQIGQSLEGLQAGDVFGRAVAMSQDGSIVAGASYESSENGFASGNVRVFRARTEDDDGASVIGWDPMGQVLVGRAELDRLGRALDMSADGLRFIAGATQFKGQGPGYAQVYDFNGTHWNQVGQDLFGDNDQGVFGRDVAMSQDGSIVACGANLANTSGFKGSGLARMYKFDSSTQQWVQLGQTILGAEEGDGLGVTVDLSANGMRVAIGAQQKKTSVGYVLVLDYDEATDTWLESGQGTLTGAEHLDKFGTDVLLSTNGKFLAVGAIGADANGDDSGHVQVFDLANM